MTVARWKVRVDSDEQVRNGIYELFFNTILGNPRRVCFLDSLVIKSGKVKVRVTVCLDLNFPCCLRRKEDLLDVPRLGAKNIDMSMDDLQSRLRLRALRDCLRHKTA